MVDTADVYSAWAPGNEGGESESIIGDWLVKRGRSGDVLIATKVGAQGGLSAANIEVRVNASLKRLRVDCVDLLYAHKDDQDTPLEETLEAFERLVRAGKARMLGASNYSGSRLEAGHVRGRHSTYLVARELLPERLALEDRHGLTGAETELGIKTERAVMEGGLEQA